MAKRYRPGTHHIQDLWHKRDGSRSQSFKRGMRWKAFWVDNLGDERSRKFPTKEAAKAHLADVVAGLKTHTYVDPERGRITVGELVEEHIAAFVGKPKSIGDKRSLAKTQVVPRWGKVPVSAVETSALKAWMADRQRGTDGQKKVSSKRARDAAMLLHTILKDAVQERRIPFDPMAGVKLPSKGQPRDQYPLTVKQLYALADSVTVMDDAADEGVKRPKPGVVQVDRALLLTLAWTGLRIGEALGLTAAAVDFNRRRIHVRRTYAQDERGRTIESTPKSHESRWVPVPPQLMGELLPVVKGRSPKQDIFIGPKGGTLRADNWRNRVFTPALESCGLYDADSPRVVHDMRHTFASLAVQSGANIKALQNAMGHKSASVTLDIYSHLFDDDLEALGNSLGKFRKEVETEREESSDGEGVVGAVRPHFDPETSDAG